MIHRRTIGLIVALLTLTSLAFSPAYGQLPVVRIGIVTDGPWEGSEEIRDLFEQEILELTRGEFDVRFPEEKLVRADWTVAGVKRAIDQLLTDREVDLMLTLGVIATHNVCHRGDLPKPVVAPFVIDPKAQELPLKDGASGIRNLCYLTFPSDVGPDVEAFLDIVPFRKMAVLVHQAYDEAIPKLVRHTQMGLQKLGVDAQVVFVGMSADEALAKIPPEAEAVFVAPLPHLPDTEFDRLVQGLIERKLPSFSWLGVREVERGILACLMPDIFPKLARRVALNVQRILLGDEPGSLPVAFAVGKRLTLNMDTARAIGVSPDWGVVTEAEIVQKARKERVRTLDITAAVQEALSANLDLAAKDRFLEADAQNIKEARARLLPQIDLSGVGTVIDEDRAEAGMGPWERTISGSVTATQVLFSERAWSYLVIQKQVHKTYEAEAEQLRLDITEATLKAYLSLLRAKTYERIQRQNLKRTRANLELARIRELVGSAGPAEVYRWESQIASNRKTVIEANTQRNLAEMALNRLLNRPLEESFETVEPDLNDPDLMKAKAHWLKHMGDKRSFRMLRDFMVEEGIEVSPELAMLDGAIGAQEQSLRSATRRFWSPTIALQGQMSRTFSEEGAGLSIPDVDDTDWTVGLSISLPLFEGGSRFAGRRKEKEKVGQLQLERQAAAERIKQRVRSSLHALGASHAGIRQAREAAEAAKRTMDVVSDAYSRGVVSVIHLLDAQNAALVADLVAANAVYDFFIDLAGFERAIGLPSFFSTSEELEALLGKLEAYFNRSQ